MTILNKNIKVASLLAMIAFIAPSCGDFLEEKPKDRIAVTNSYTTEQDAFSAVNAVYAHLNSQSFDTFGGVYHSSFWARLG